jgi:titin
MDGTLCLFINGNASATHAFRVPAGASSARLNVQGLILASFSDAAIRLEDGSGHRISGNQFGAVPFTSANGAAVRVTGASGGALIGGFDDVGAVNVIAGAADAGIYLDNTAGGSVVGNNVIGFQPNGMFAVGNSIGIFVFNSPANNLQYNFIGNSTSNGITLSGAASSGNILQHNTIGVGYELAPAANAGAGVGVIFAAHDNTIGAVLTGTGGGNQIVDNVGPGVWISNSGGGGNRVLANEMTGNGGIDIDLAALGASPNQPLNPDSGPNRMQNHPVLTSATRFQAIGTIRVTGGMHSAPSSTYRIDVYFDGNCDASSPSRGNALAWRGRGSMTTNASGDGSFILDVPAYPGVPSLGVVAATATSSTGDTSEISNCFAETSGTLVDLVFANGME